MLPFDNDTRAVEKKIAKKSFSADRMRNIFAVAAIVMTTILFTGLFTLGLVMKESTQRANMILSGGDGHARIINMSGTDYEKISAHPSIYEMAYCRKLADSVDNKALSKRETIFWYYDDLGMEYQFTLPDRGNKPTAENEIITDTETLELLGVPQKIGEEVTLELSVHGRKVMRSFILSGWWESYPGVQYGTILTSKAYVDAHESELVDTFQKDQSDTGTITGIIKFKDTRDIEAKLNAVVEDSGYSTDIESENYINAGANPYYTSTENSDKLGTTLTALAALAAFFLTGYLIIYNIFQISVLKDMHFYGLLKTVGMTQRQIYSVIRRQIWKLSLIGIPIGLCGGFFIGKAFLPLVMKGSSLSDIYAASDAYTTVSPKPFIFLASAAFALATVRFGIRRPAKMAARVSPVEALRFMDEEQGTKKKDGKAAEKEAEKRKGKNAEKEAEKRKGRNAEKKIQKRGNKKTKNSSLQRRMAWRNLGRNKKRTVLVVLSLSLSIILANAVFHIAGSVDPEKAMKDMIAFDFRIGQSSLLDNYAVEEESALSESFIRAVEQQPGFVRGGREYGCKAEYTSETTVQEVNREEDGGFSTHLYGLDGLLLSQLEVMDGELDTDRLSSGKYILEGVYSNTRGEIDYSSMNHEVGDKVKILYNGESREFTVLAHVKANEANTYDWVGSCFFLPDETYTEFTGNHVMTYNFDVEPEKEADMNVFLKQYTTDEEPDMTYRSKETIMAGVKDIQNIVMSVGGMMALIIGAVGVLNFTNTILTSIFTRRKELAALQSVGMTGKQMEKMLRWEGCAYIMLALMISLPLCAASMLLFIRPVCEQIWFLDFKVNVLPLLVIVLLLFMVGIIIPYIAYRMMRRQSIIERLKGENI